MEGSFLGEVGHVEDEMSTHRGAEQVERSEGVGEYVSGSLKGLSSRAALEILEEF